MIRWVQSLWSKLSKPFKPVVHVEESCLYTDGDIAVVELPDGSRYEGPVRQMPARFRQHYEKGRREAEELRQDVEKEFAAMHTRLSKLRKRHGFDPFKNT